MRLGEEQILIRVVVRGPKAGEGDLNHLPRLWDREQQHVSESAPHRDAYLLTELDQRSPFGLQPDLDRLSVESQRSIRAGFAALRHLDAEPVWCRHQSPAGSRRK